MVEAGKQYTGDTILSNWFTPVLPELINLLFLKKFELSFCLLNH